MFFFKYLENYFPRRLQLIDENIPKTESHGLRHFFFDMFGGTLGRNGKGPQKALFLNITQMVWACPTVCREQIKTACHVCIFNNVEIFRELWNLQDMLTTIFRFDLNSFWV